MRTKRTLVILVTVALSAGFYLLLRTDYAVNNIVRLPVKIRNAIESLPLVGNKVALASKRAEEAYLFSLPYLAPIEFYGKVTDQHGLPVPQATISISVNDSQIGSGSEYVEHSDAAGMFSIRGMHGAQLLIQVSKKGYIGFNTKNGKFGSGNGFDYGANFGHGIHHPDSRSPVEFKLYRLGVLEPLKGLREHVNLSRTGQTIRVSLDLENPNSERCVDFTCWSKDKEPRPAGERRFDWKLEIMVPNGGLKLRDELVFEAPESDYQQYDKLEMRSVLPDNQWSSQVERDYFVKFKDGTFARFHIETYIGGNNYLMWKSYLNPKIGSRNLEVDTTKITPMNGRTIFGGVKVTK